MNTTKLIEENMINTFTKMNITQPTDHYVISNGSIFGIGVIVVIFIFVLTGCLVVGSKKLGPWLYDFKIEYDYLHNRYISPSKYEWPTNTD